MLSQLILSISQSSGQFNIQFTNVSTSLIRNDLIMLLPEIEEKFKEMKCHYEEEFAMIK